MTATPQAMASVAWGLATPLVSHTTKFGAKRAFSRACAKVNLEVLIFEKNVNLVHKLNLP
jgi:hypothetical protein